MFSRKDVDEAVMMDASIATEAVGVVQVVDASTPPQEWLKAFALSYNALSHTLEGEQEARQIWEDGDEQWRAARMVNGTFLGEQDGREEVDVFWHIGQTHSKLMQPTHYHTSEYLM